VEIKVREGHPIAPEALQDLYEFAPWARGRSVPGIRTMLANTNYQFSAWDGDRLVGFARVLTDGIYRATLWDVIVHPEYQNRGVGEKLMLVLLAHPALSVIEKFWLNTRNKYSYYEKFGFARSDQGMVRLNPKFNSEGTP
jgi:ribosomal protein S18 acetylase RimI-like enzyme